MLSRDPLPASVSQALKTWEPALNGPKLRELCGSLGIDVDGVDTAVKTYVDELQPVWAPWGHSLPDMAGMITRLIGTVGNACRDPKRLEDAIHESMANRGFSWGVINAVAAAEMSGKWSPQSIRSLILDLESTHREPIDMMMFQGCNIESGLHTLMSWCVFGILAAPRFVEAGVSADTKSFLHEVVTHEVMDFAKAHYFAQTQGRLNNSEILNKFEGVLIQLAIQHPQTGEFVVSALEALSNARVSTEVPQDNFSERVDELFPPDSVSAATNVNLAVEVASQRASTRRALAVLGSFDGLMQASPWSDPFSAVAKKLNQGVTRLRVGALSMERLRFIETLVDHMKSELMIYYPTSELEIIPADSDQVAEVVNALSGYVRGDRITQQHIAEIAGIKAAKSPAFHRLFDELSMLSQKVGSDRITIITDADLEKRVQGGGIKSGVVLGEPHLSVPGIRIRFRPRSPDAEKVDNFERFMAYPLMTGSFILGAVTTLLEGYVVPQLLELHQGQGHRGLVAWDPFEAFRIAVEKGLVPEHMSNLGNLHPDITVLYGQQAGPDDESEEIVPAEDVPDALRLV